MCGLMDSGVQKVASAVNYESCREQGEQRERGRAVSSGKVRKLLAATSALMKCARGWVNTVRYASDISSNRVCVAGRSFSPLLPDFSA